MNKSIFPMKMNRNSWWKVVVAICVIIAIFIIYNVYYIMSSTWDTTIVPDNDKITSCTWDENMPVFFNIKTKLGVNYDAGHWFHMAENIMTQHAILGKRNMLSNNSRVFYNFDKDAFTNDLNGVTRLMVYLGTIAAHTNVKQLQYFSTPALWKNNLKSGDTILIDRKALSKAQILNFSPNQLPSERFVKPSAMLPITANNGEESTVCLKYVSTIGGLWPTPQRGSWFPTNHDIVQFRQKLKDACPPNSDKLETVKKQKRYKLVIYQRDLSRKLANEEDAIRMLKEKLPSDQWDIQVLMHSSSRSPCELAHILHNVDVFLTPHGFQSMLLLFLPRPSLLVEVYPYRYYKRGYGPLSHEYGLIHTGVMSPATLWHTKLLLYGIQTSTCMQWKDCRGYSRNQDVMLTQHGVNRVMEQIDVHVVRNRYISSDAAAHNQKLPSSEFTIYEDHIVYHKLPAARDYLY